MVARFQREGQALTALRSPHTITAYELGETPDGVLYIAMELLRGASLYHRLRDDGPMPWRRVAAIPLTLSWPFSASGCRPRNGAGKTL